MKLINMKVNTEPLPYPEWSNAQFNREEDAAYNFGYYLIKHCREEVLGRFSETVDEATMALLTDAVDNSLHNVMDLLEGFFMAESGSEHRLGFDLQVAVYDKNYKEVERVNIASGLDLPIGYWKWAIDKEFQ